MDDLLQQIKQHLYGKTRINVNINKDSWWVKKGLTDLKQQLLDLTTFLNADAPWKQRIWHIENSVFEIPVCKNPDCNNKLKWGLTGYGVACSKQCTQKVPDVTKKREATNITRYGSKTFAGTQEHILKTKETFEEKYNGHPMKCESIRAKLKKTKKEKYGDPNYNNIEKAKETKKEKYGDPDYNNPKKARKTMIAKYGVVAYPQLTTEGDVSVLEKARLSNELKSKTPSQIAEEYNLNPTSVYNAIHRHNIEYEFTSFSTELKLENLLKELNVEYIKNDRMLIKPKEVDFYIPDYNLAIEINGIYWHSTASPAFRDKDYHYEKWKQCRDKGVTLLSYTDADLNNNFDVIKSKLMYMVGHINTVIGARKVVIDKVTTEQELKFVDENHIQGRLLARDNALGAYYNGNLVAVINWRSRPKYLEITRYVCDRKASYPGLFSKMLKAMIKQTGHTGDIVSFSNNDHSNGNLYKQAGFKLDKIFKSAYWYTYDFKHLENRQKYMKAKIAKRFGVDVENKTEWQLMQELGYARYYDSGKIRWVLTV